jgi:hypothetical protein
MWLLLWTFWVVRDRDGKGCESWNDEIGNRAVAIQFGSVWIRGFRPLLMISESLPLVA